MKELQNDYTQLPLISVEQFTQSMRDSGYKSPASAITDLMDNSIQANAKKIGVFTRTGKIQRNKKEITGVTDIFLIDDGEGMDPNQLQTAPMWGGSSRHNDRSDLGRFGIGAPAAASYLSENFAWLSKTQNSELYELRIDLRAVAEGSYTIGSQVLVPRPEPTEIPSDVLEYAKKHGIDIERSGCIVHIKNPDRLHIAGWFTPKSFDAKLQQECGLIYRHRIENHEIFVNDQLVAPVDPLFLMQSARGYDVGNGLFGNPLPTAEFTMKNRLPNGEEREGKITVRYSWMQRPNQECNLPGFITPIPADGDKSGTNTRKQVMAANNRSNLIICRAGRQIDVINGPTREVEGVGAKVWNTPMNNDRFWAVEIDFEPTLDEAFGVTVNKQQITPQVAVWDLLREKGIPEAINVLKKLSGEEANKAKVQTMETQIGTENAAKAMQLAALESGESRAIKSEEIEKQAESNLERGIQEEIMKNPEKEAHEVRSSMLDEAKETGFEIKFDDIPEAPFFRPQKWGGVTRIYVNRQHKFYDAIWNASDPVTGKPFPGLNRVHDAIQLMFFALGERELTGTDDKVRFYAQERKKWSDLIGGALEKLEGIVPIEQEILDTEEAKETEREAS